MNYSKDLLQQPIGHLPLSEELKILLLHQGNNSLQDVVDAGVARWQEYPSFTYHHQHEIIHYLQEHDLLDYLKDK